MLTQCVPTTTRQQIGEEGQVGHAFVEGRFEKQGEIAFAAGRERQLPLPLFVARFLPFAFYTVAFTVAFRFKVLLLADIW